MSVIIKDEISISKSLLLLLTMFKDLIHLVLLKYDRVNGSFIKEISREFVLKTWQDNESNLY